MGTTVRVASIRLEGQAFHDSRTPSGGSQRYCRGHGHGHRREQEWDRGRTEWFGIIFRLETMIASLRVAGRNGKNGTDPLSLRPRTIAVLDVLKVAGGHDEGMRAG